VVNTNISNCHVRILVVGDHKEWRQQICSVLAAQPELEVIGEASDGLEAVQKAAGLKPDLILLDIGLPGLNGIEVARRICQQSPGVKILFVSGNNDPELIRGAPSNGAQGYVLKVDVSTKLLPTLKEILQSDPCDRLKTSAAT
jgi:DNA-binding NarL/FixJ family response regulator